MAASKSKNTGIREEIQKRRQQWNRKSADSDRNHIICDFGRMCDPDGKQFWSRWFCGRCDQ